jgi:hypothetical protein
MTPLSVNSYSVCAVTEHQDLNSDVDGHTHMVEAIKHEEDLTSHLPTYASPALCQKLEVLCDIPRKLKVDHVETKVTGKDTEGQSGQPEAHRCPLVSMHRYITQEACHDLDFQP